MSNRRDFLKTCAFAGGALAFSGSSRLAFSATEANTYDTLIVVFLRGAMDGLHLFSPGGNNSSRAAYETARPCLKIPLAGTGAGLAVSSDQWRIHPRASALFDLYTAGKLAVVLGAGMPGPVTRSHFDAQVRMELGLTSSEGTGWLTRVLQSATLPSVASIPALSVGSMTAASLLASNDAITLSSGPDFRIDSGSRGWNWSMDFETGPTGARGLFTVLPDVWTGSGALDRPDARRSMRCGRSSRSISPATRRPTARPMTTMALPPSSSCWRS